LTSSEPAFFPPNRDRSGPGLQCFNLLFLFTNPLCVVVKCGVSSALGKSSFSPFRERVLPPFFFFLFLFSFLRGFRFKRTNCPSRFLRFSAPLAGGSIHGSSLRLRPPQDGERPSLLEEGKGRKKDVRWLPTCFLMNAFGECSPLPQKKVFPELEDSLLKSFPFPPFQSYS